LIDIIAKTEQFVYKEHEKDSSGHDWHHIDRVRKLALRIAQAEHKGDAFIIEMAALLHDIPDEKLNEQMDEGEKKLTRFLDTIQVSDEQKLFIIDIVKTISFKGGNEADLHSYEAMVVRDADRLDAIGAIGIARTFAYGGKKGQAMYNPSLPVRTNMSLNEYRNGQTSSIHHFYEKLLKLKDLLHTETAKQLAEERHQFMEMFLQQFYKEWDVD